MEKEKKDKISRYVTSTIVFTSMLLLLRIVYSFSWILDIGMSLAMALFFFFALKYNWFKTKDKEKEKRDEEFVKSLDTQTLRKLIEDQNEFINKADREYYKRKDKNLKDKIGNQVANLIGGGVMIFLLGLFMFGGMADMFSVNNEFINPTNFNNIDSLGNATNSIDTIGNACSFTLTTLMNVGKGNPKLWFWLFWVAVLMFFILPLVKILIYIINKIFSKKSIKIKGGKE